MSSGPGDQSRLYKTTDGCQSWKLLFTNPDKDGFWDALQFDGKQNGLILGDPVNHRFTLFVTDSGGLRWRLVNAKGLHAEPRTEAIFAASNSSMAIFGPYHRFFVTGGPGGAAFIECDPFLEVGKDPEPGECIRLARKLPLAPPSASAGAFSMAAGAKGFVVVGGDYLKPDDTVGTAAYELTFDNTDWFPAQTPPHGYRSAVAYDANTKTWITVGPNGTDISTDDGRNWRALKPTLQDAPDADKNWNALSLPFVVGPHGRIGKLRATAIAPASPSSSVAAAKP
jgi:hypothetical protein